MSSGACAHVAWLASDGSGGGPKRIMLFRFGGGVLVSKSPAASATRVTHESIAVNTSRRGRLVLTSVFLCVVLVGDT